MGLPPLNLAGGGADFSVFAKGRLPTGPRRTMPDFAVAAPSQRIVSAQASALSCGRGRLLTLKACHSAGAPLADSGDGNGHRLAGVWHGEIAGWPCVPGTCLPPPTSRFARGKFLTLCTVSSEEEALFPDSPTSPAADDSPMAGGAPAATAGGAGHQWLQD